MKHQRMTVEFFWRVGDGSKYVKTKKYRLTIICGVKHIIYFFKLTVIYLKKLK